MRAYPRPAVIRAAAALLAALSLASFAETASGSIEPPAEPRELRAAVFSLGKADATLIYSEGGAVLIDAGEEEHGRSISEYIADKGIERIDCLIITHFHKDHVGGAAEIIESFDIGAILVPNYGKDSARYGAFMRAAEGAGVEVIALEEPFAFEACGAAFAVYPPMAGYFDFGGAYGEDENDAEDDGDAAPKENNYSLAIVATHGETRMLFAGDAKSKRLRELMSIGEITSRRFDFMLAPHHGGACKRSFEFVMATMPRNAAITCSDGEPADEDVLEALEAVGASVYPTTGGDVICVSDGKEIKVGYE